MVEVVFKKWGGCFRSIIGVGEWVTKSDIRLEEERVKRL